MRKTSLSVSDKMVSRRASSWPLVFLSPIFRYFPAFQVVTLVEYPVLFILNTCLMDCQQDC